MIFATARQLSGNSSFEAFKNRITKSHIFLSMSDKMSYERNFKFIEQILYHLLKENIVKEQWFICEC